MTKTVEQRINHGIFSLRCGDEEESLIIMHPDTFDEFLFEKYGELSHLYEDDAIANPEYKKIPIYLSNQCGKHEVIVK